MIKFAALIFFSCKKILYWVYKTYINIFFNSLLKTWNIDIKYMNIWIYNFIKHTKYGNLPFHNFPSFSKLWNIENFKNNKTIIDPNNIIHLIYPKGGVRKKFYIYKAKTNINLSNHMFLILFRLEILFLSEAWDFNSFWADTLI